MKKHFKILASILLMMVADLASAQTNANDVVKNIVKSFRDPKNVELTFSYRFFMGEESTSEEQKGMAYLQGEAYKIVLQEQQTISDGNTIWSYLVDDEEVTVSNATEGSDNTPLKLLTTLDQDYTPSFTTNNTITLTNPKSHYNKIKLTLDKKQALKSMEIFADDDSRMVINITEMKDNQDLKDDFFSFNAKDYPKVEIIDMR